ncbi:MAG: YihY/virulence factor BrkB family protein [Clostridiales bacterium]|nr:YihY/virulence factor BrkB family protein [Clostridiales bacterium]
MEKRVNGWVDRMSERYYPVRLLYCVVGVFLDRRISRSGAEFAYYALMTIFPLLIMVIGIIGVLPVSDAQVLSVIEAILPEQIYVLLEEYVAYVLNNLSIALLITGLISMLTAASAAFRSLISISGEIYCRKVFRGVKYFLFSVLYSVLLIVFIYFTMVIVFTGSWFIQMVNDIFSISIPTKLWNWSRAGIMFGLAMLLLMLIYRITSPGGRHHPPVASGALFASLALTLFTWLFSFFITLSNRYSMIYGSLASIVLLMMWLYFCGTIVILGVVVNYVRWQHKQGLEVRYILEHIL